MIEDLIDMHEAAKQLGCTTATAEKYLNSVGVEPVAQIGSRAGHIRFYRRGQISAARPTYDEWHADNLHRRGVTAAHARHGTNPEVKPAVRVRKIIASPASVKKLERLAEALADVLNDLAAK